MITSKPSTSARSYLTSMLSSSELETNDRFQVEIKAADLCTNTNPVLLIICNCNGITDTDKTAA